MNEPSIDLDTARREAIEAVTIPIVGEPRVFRNHKLGRHLIDQRDVIWTPHTAFLYQPGHATNPFMQPMNGKEFLEYATGGGHLMSAHVCDYLEDHPERWFEEWKKPVGNALMTHGVFRKVHFCGTIFTDEHGNDAVKTLFWDFEVQKLAAIFSSLRGLFFYNDFAASPHFV